MPTEKELEKVSLLKDRWYIIMQKIDDENFSMTAYDTTSRTEGEDEDYIDAGLVAQQGLIELLQNDLDRVMQAGLARITFEEVAESIIEEIESEIDNVTKFPEIKRQDNVIKVDFGTKQ